MKKIICILLTLCLLLSITACASGSDDLMENIQTKGIQKPTCVEVSLAEPGDFGLRLFRQCYENQKNTLISPLSVLSALAMTANGAKGETLSQMEEVLGMDVTSLNNWISSYMSALESIENGKLSLANSIWFKDTDSFTVNQDFLQLNADYYGAGIFKAPFDDSTKNDINRWVEEHTDGMVKDILDKIPEEAVMYLVNALAFDAQWQEIYEKSDIRDGTFTNINGAKVDVEMMYSTEHKYLEDDFATGFIKYYEGRDYAFVALLPNQGMTLEGYLDTLTGEKLQALLSNPGNVTVRAGIPKFELEYDVQMSEILEAMGMTDAFNGTLADFSGTGTSTEGNLYISRVLHKTYICVDGKGTRAGAATVVEEVCESAAMEPDFYVVNLDRPFAYMLIDTQRNLPFFIGTMLDPSGEFAYPVIEEPPAGEDLSVMTVRDGDVEFTVSSGNFSLLRPGDDGKMTGIIACGTHPLDVSQDYQTVTGDRLILSFAAEPDEITMRRWPGNNVGNVNAPGEPVTLEDLTLPIEKGEWVYEINVVWEKEDWSGEASFHLYISR